jgi:hypothetical protein
MFTLIVVFMLASRPPIQLPGFASKELCIAAAQDFQDAYNQLVAPYGSQQTKAMAVCVRTSMGG